MGTGWASIGRGFPLYVIAQGNVLYGLELDDTKEVAAYRYDPKPTSRWTAIRSPQAWNFRGNEHALYALVPQEKGGYVSLFGNDEWQQLGTYRFDTFFLSPHDVYGVENGTRDLLHFDEVTRNWTRAARGPIGQEFLVASDLGVYRLLDKSGGELPQILEEGKWKTIGKQAVRALVPADNALYSQQGPRGERTVRTLRYNPLLDSWDVIGDFPALATYGTELYGYGDSRGVHEFSGTPKGWTRVADPVDHLVVGNTNFVGTTWSDTLVCPKPRQTDGMPPRETRSRSSGRATSKPATRQPPSGWDWLFVFDATGAFDGELWLQPWAEGRVFRPQLMPVIRYRSGRLYAAPLTLEVGLLDAISLWTQLGYPPWRLKLRTVNAWNRIGDEMYEFAVNGEVPGEPNTTMIWPLIKQRNPPFKLATIYVWEFNFPYAVGHASMMLSNGTYISWWPKDEDPRSLSYRGYSFKAPPQNPWTYDDDCRMEEHEPDFVFPVADLDEGKIEKWWNDFKTNSSWYLFGNNCARTVFHALVAGGAVDRLSHNDQSYFITLHPFKPSDIVALAQRIAAAPMHSP